MLFRKICGVDLGTDTIKICDKNEKLYICEKNRIAIRNGRQVIAVGQKAYEIYEKAPANVEASCPMQKGAIADVKNLGIVLSQLLRRYSNVVSRYPDVILTVPVGISELERMAYHRLLTEELMAKRVALIENGLADGAGIGMPILHPMGNMVIDMGASTTDMNVISEGKIIVGKRLPLGGHHLDEEIISMVRRRYDLHIGHRSAEILKNNLSYVLHGVSRQMRVFGIHAVTGLPSSVIISSEDVNEAIGDTFCEIGEEAKKTLERTPPQLASDIYKNGVYLTGGVSQIANLAEYMSHRIGVTTYPVPDPQESGARGLVRIMNDPELRKLTFSVKDL